MNGEVRIIPCPICGRETGVTEHAYRRWTPQQDWLMRRLQAIGLHDNTTARILGVSPGAVRNRRLKLLERRA